MPKKLCFFGRSRMTLFLVFAVNPHFFVTHRARQALLARLDTSERGGVGRGKPLSRVFPSEYSMAKSREQKVKAVQELSDFLSKSKSVVFSTYQGLGMKDQDTLRNTLRDKGACMMVEKKTLMKRALADSGIGVADESVFTGPIAMTFSLEDEVTAAKTLKDFAKSHEQIQILGGILDRAFITADRMKALASLPSKQEMLARTVGTIKAPISGFVNVMAGNLRGLVNVLNALQSSKTS